MLINFYGELDKFAPVELEVNDIRQVIAGIKHTYGNELSNILLTKEYKYILINSKNPEDVIALHPDLVTMNFAHYDILYIIPSIEGDFGLGIGAAVAAAIGATAAAAAVIAFAVELVLTVALSIAVGALMQLISPTPHFTEDPAVTQSKKLQSNLFNGAPNIREQGGAIPLAYGHTVGGGVLISGGIFTEEITL